MKETVKRGLCRDPTSNIYFWEAMSGCRFLVGRASSFGSGRPVLSHSPMHLILDLTLFENMYIKRANRFQLQVKTN